jgi:hypothetical protein
MRKVSGEGPLSPAVAVGRMCRQLNHEMDAIPLRSASLSLLSSFGSFIICLITLVCSIEKTGPKFERNI